MPKRTTGQQLADAQQRLNQLREKSRTEETRRKIIIGGMMLRMASNNPEVMKNLMRQLDKSLPHRHRDRRVFFEYGIGQIAGLYGAKLHPVQPGWALGRSLSPVIRHNRYSS